MAVSQQQINTNMVTRSKISPDLSKILAFIKDYCHSFKTIECCGFLGYKDGEYFIDFVNNRSPQPNDFFHIDPLEYLNFQNKCDLIAVVHSHPNSDEQFSELDISSAEACCSSFLLYCVPLDKFLFYVPKNIEIDVNILNKVKGLL